MSVTDWGETTVGRLTLRETWELSGRIHGTTGVRSVVLGGQESFPPLTLAQLRQRREDLATMAGALVPVLFEDKADHNGYYLVKDVQAEELVYTGSGAARFGWTLELEYVGPDNATDLESRLTGASRSTDHALTAERWHAPPIGHHSYFTGTTQPSIMTRTGTDGAMTIYRDIPASRNPRWGCAPADYPDGRVRFIDSVGVERAAGNGLIVTGTAWEIHNGLVRVQLLDNPNGVLTVSARDGAAWSAKGWDLRQNAVSLGLPDAVTIVRNDFEMITARLLWSNAPGRSLADVTLRRGSRFAEVLLQADRSTTLAIRRETAEAGTAGTGFVRATADDMDGNRYAVGSARTFTNDLTTGGLSKAAAVQLDAFIGCELGGSTAVAGDTAADLIDQYLGCMAETTTAVRR